MMTLAECRSELITACASDKAPTKETFNKAIDSVTRLERIRVWLDPDIDQELAMERILEIVQEG